MDVNIISFEVNGGIGDLEVRVSRHTQFLHHARGASVRIGHVVFVVEIQMLDARRRFARANVAGVWPLETVVLVQLLDLIQAGVSTSWRSRINFVRGAAAVLHLAS